MLERRAAAAAAIQRIYAIGDIHGRFDLFRRLMNVVALDQATRPGAATQIILLGNIIDRGADAARMVRGCMHLTKLTPHFLVLKGNHEDMMAEALGGSLAVYSHWLDFGGRETLLGFGVDPAVAGGSATRDNLAIAAKTVGDEVLDWLSDLPLLHSHGNHLFVHAGIRPGIEISDQQQDDLLWIKDEFLNSAVPHGLTVVHGHSASDAPVFARNRIGIDTGAHRTNRLTALGIENGYTWALDTQSSPDAVPKGAGHEVGAGYDASGQALQTVSCQTSISADAVVFGDERLDADLAAVLGGYDTVALPASTQPRFDAAIVSMLAPSIGSGPAPSDRIRSDADPVVGHGINEEITPVAPIRRSRPVKASLPDLLISRRAYATIAASLLFALFTSIAILFQDGATVERREPIGKRMTSHHVTRVIPPRGERAPNEDSSSAPAKVASEARLAALARPGEIGLKSPMRAQPLERSTRSPTRQYLPRDEQVSTLEHLKITPNDAGRLALPSRAAEDLALEAVGANTDAIASYAAMRGSAEKEAGAARVRRASVEAIRSLRRQ